MPEQAYSLPAPSTNGFYPSPPLSIRLVGGFYGMHIQIFMKRVDRQDQWLLDYRALPSLLD